MENIDDFRPQFLEATNLKSDDLIFIWTIKKINKRGKSKKRILVITSNCIYIVEKRPLRRGLKISRRYGFESIKSIEKDDKDQIIIVNDEHNLIFKEEPPNSIVVPILEQIVTIFTQEEQPKLPILQKLSLEVKPKPNPSFWRLKFKAFLSKKSHLVDVDIRQLMNILITIDTLDFSIFSQYKDLYDEILDSLLVYPNIQKIIFRLCYPSWSAISKFFSVNKSVSSLETYQPIDSNFIQFARSYLSNNESKLNTLNFNDNEFGPEFIEGLKLILQPSKIISLSIRNQLSKEGYQAIAPLILNFEGFQSVKYFDVSGCKYVEPEFVIIQLTNLTTLKINDCSIDISVLLEDLSKNKHIPLTDIQCCDSFCSEKLDTSYFLSDRIKNFVVDNIAWQGSSLSKFLHILSNSEKAQINLSIRDAQMRDPEWHILDEFLQNFMSNTIVSLDYSGNKIQSGFCTFINNSPNLTKLTLNGCFSFSENNIEIFSRYLSSNQNLEELYVIGTDTHYLSSSITFLFKALKTTNFLHVLDISHNMIGNHIFNLILDLITSNLNLMDIYFDFNGISDPQSLRQFIFKMTSLDRKVNIHFPISDISSMVKNKFIQESEVEKIKENLFIVDDNNNEEKSISNSNFSRERKNSLRSRRPSIPIKSQTLSSSTSSALQSYRSSVANQKQFSQPSKSPLLMNQMKRLGSLSSIDAFSQSLSKDSTETFFSVRSTSTNSLNKLNNNSNTTMSKIAGDSCNNNSDMSDGSSAEYTSSKKKKPRRSSDIMFVENKSDIPLEEQIKFERVRDEYVSDNQWISFLNDIPSVNIESTNQSLENQFSYYSLMQALQPK